MNVAAFLAAAVAAHPERIALVPAAPSTARLRRRFRAGGEADARAMTFRDLDEASACVAGALGARGIAAGDRVVLLARPSPALYAAVIGVLRIGATAVFLDRRLLRSGAARALAAAEPRAIVGDARWLAARWAVPGLGRIPTAIALDAAIRAGRSHAVVVPAPDEAPALIAFTGGTLGGHARAVVRTHGTLAAQHRALAGALPVLDGDVDFTAFPMVTLHNLAAGVTTLLPERPFAPPEGIDPRAMLEAFARHGVTTASAAPAFWRHAADGWLAAGATTTLRRIAIGGAPLPPRLPGILSAVAPRAAIVGVYGSTEAEPVAVLDAGERATERAERCAAGWGYPLGAPVPEASVRIAVARGAPAPDGAVGRLVVAGAHVAPAAGWRGAPDAHDGRAGEADRAGADGDARSGERSRRWHAMGDVAYRHAGELWLVGREGSAIPTAAGDVWPGRVEAAAEALPFVRRAALVGLPSRPPSDRATARPCLVVQPEPGRAIEAEGAEGRARLAAAWHAAIARSTSACPGDVAGEATAGGSGAAFEAPGLALPLIRVARRLPMDRRHHARIDRGALRRQLLRRELPSNLGLYLRERFPPLAYTLLILSYFGANVFLARAVDAGAPAPGAPWRFAAGAAALWLMFLHLRVVDEHKDAERDLALHPDRVLSRGLVTLGQLRALGIAAVALELALSAALGRGALIGCLIVLALTALIARDFFAARLLERRMLLNAAVHMAIMPAYGLYAYAVATARPPWAAPGLVLAYAGVGYGVGLGLEIARKIRAPGDERPGLLTYSGALGPLPAAYAMLAALAGAGAISALVGRALGFEPWYHGAVAALLAVAGAGVLDFRRRTDRAAAARLQGYAGAFILAFDVLLIVALARAGRLGPW